MSKNSYSKFMLYAAFAAWYDNCIKGQRSEATCRSYQLAMKQIKDYQKDVQIKNVSEKMIQTILNEMARRAYAKSTIDKVRIVFQSTMRFAVRENWLSFYPIIKLNVPKTATVKKVNALTVYQQKQVEAFCMSQKSTYGYISIFLLKTGLRVAELCNLKWNDYYVEGNCTYIVIRKSKTLSGERLVPLNKLAKEIIERQPRMNPYIFNSLQGKPVTQTVLKKHNRQVREALDLKEFHNHICRHTFATRALEKGMNIKVLSKILGHSSVAFTMTRYTDVSASFMYEQMQLMNC